MTDAPIACTLTGGAYEDRLAWIGQLNKDGLRRHHRHHSSLELHYAAHLRDRVHELVRKESACCAFLGFAIDDTPDGVRVTITVPERALAVADDVLSPFVPPDPGGLTRRGFLAATGIMVGVTGGTIAAGSTAGSDGDIAARFEEASRVIRARTDSGDVAAAVLHVRQAGKERSRAFGRATVDLPFLLASPTKPMTAAAVLWLRDRRELALTDAVGKYLPEFRGDARGDVTIRHLLTHTSGLPDMLPENAELRRQHAPLSEFVARTCRTPLLFAPGAKVSYQSMGILLAAAIAEKVAGEPMPALLTRTIFGPLGLSRTSLGLGGRAIADTAQCQVPDAERSDWDWNSPYWRNLASPWGGAHGTARDLAAFVEAFASAGDAMLSAATRREMRTVQTGALHPSFGFGWQREPGAFGRTCSAETFGHSGSTGTVAWHDPASGTTCVLLTTRPAASSRSTLLVPVSEIIGRTTA